MDGKSHVLKKNISYGLIYKFAAMVLTFLIVPLLIKGLGVVNYGLWVTIFSIFGWVYLLDLGIGNGVKNNLTIALSKENYTDANQYITTAYMCVVFISFFFLTIFGILIFVIDLSSFLNIALEEWFLKTIFFITLIFFTLNFILSLYKQFFYSIQRSSSVELSAFLYNALVYVQVYFITSYSTNGLLEVTIIYGLSNLIIGIIWNCLFFKENKNINF
jgi:O-antigen/teichoic acid export membrane protein